jgi:hypothetical protein
LLSRSGGGIGVDDHLRPIEPAWKATLGSANRRGMAISARRVSFVLAPPIIRAQNLPPVFDYRPDSNSGGSIAPNSNFIQRNHVCCAEQSPSRQPNAMSRRGRTASFYHALLLDVPAPAHWGRCSGSVSGTRFARASSLWPDRFPPSHPQPVAQPCSETSQVLPVCPTSQLGSTSAYVLGLPDAAQVRCGPGQSWDLPVPAQGASVHARGL